MHARALRVRARDAERVREEAGEPRRGDDADERARRARPRRRACGGGGRLGSSARASHAKPMRRRPHDVCGKPARLPLGGRSYDRSTVIVPSRPRPRRRRPALAGALVAAGGGLDPRAATRQPRTGSRRLLRPGRLLRTATPRAPTRHEPSTGPAADARDAAGPRRRRRQAARRLRRRVDPRAGRVRPAGLRARDDAAAARADARCRSRISSRT